MGEMPEGINSMKREIKYVFRNVYGDIRVDSHGEFISRWHNVTDGTFPELREQIMEDLDIFLEDCKGVRFSVDRTYCVKEILAGDPYEHVWVRVDLGIVAYCPLTTTTLLTPPEFLLSHEMMEEDFLPEYEYTSDRR